MNNVITYKPTYIFLKKKSCNSYIPNNQF